LLFDQVMSPLHRPLPLPWLVVFTLSCGSITNLSIEVVETADTASARSYYTVLQATPALGLQPIVAGRYEDRFVRIRGTWRFTERFVHVDLVGDLSQHVRGGFT